MASEAAGGGGGRKEESSGERARASAAFSSSFSINCTQCKEERKANSKLRTQQEGNIGPLKCCHGKQRKKNRLLEENCCSSLVVCFILHLLFKYLRTLIAFYLFFFFFFCRRRRRHVFDRHVQTDSKSRTWRASRLHASVRVIKYNVVGTLRTRKILQIKVCVLACVFLYEPGFVLISVFMH